MLKVHSTTTLSKHVNLKVRVLHGVSTTQGGSLRDHSPSRQATDLSKRCERWEWAWGRGPSYCLLVVIYRRTDPSAGRRSEEVYSR